MFYVVPVITLFGGHIILILAAIIPAIILIRYIYKSDRLDKESPSIIGKLVLMGIVSTFIAIMCERLGSIVLGICTTPKRTTT